MDKEILREGARTTFEEKRKKTKKKKQEGIKRCKEEKSGRKRNVGARKEKQASSTKETSERSCGTEWNGRKKDEIKEEANKKKKKFNVREKGKKEKKGKKNIHEHGKNYENKVKWAKRTTNEEPWERLKDSKRRVWVVVAPGPMFANVSQPILKSITDSVELCRLAEVPRNLHRTSVQC